MSPSHPAGRHGVYMTTKLILQVDVLNFRRWFEWAGWLVGSLVITNVHLGVVVVVVVDVDVFILMMMMMMI